VGFVDFLLGRLLDRLRELGIYDRALVVVTSDHGASFVPGDRRRNVTPVNFGDVLPVPLFVKLPGQARTGSPDRTALTIDILPTIAEVVGATIPWSLDGHSLLADRPDRTSVSVRVVSQREKGALRFPVPQLLAKRDAAVARRQARWHSGPWDSVFRPGPRASLVGMRVAELGVSGEAPPGIMQRRLQPPHDREHFVSSLVSGVARGEASREPRDLAVALDGTIRATTRTRPDPARGDRMVWQALIDESDLRPGPNTVEVFVIEGPNDAPTLLRVGSAATHGGGER
jgi:hypothetical protein